MPYLTKQLPNGQEVGITSCEIVLPIHALQGMDDVTIALLVKELAQDYEFIKDYLGDIELDFMTIEQAKARVVELQRQKRTQGVKKELTRLRRSEFNLRRTHLILALIDRDGYICQHSGCALQEDLTIDHVVPLSKGGSDDLSNLRLLCRKHNSTKSDTKIG
jgi:hypothetical protein